MIRVVVGVTVAVKWLVPEQNSAAARALLRSDVVLLASDLIRAEVGDVLWTRWPRGELNAAEVEVALTEFRRFPLEVHSAEPLLTSARAIARDRTGDERRPDGIRGSVCGAGGGAADAPGHRRSAPVRDPLKRPARGSLSLAGGPD
jgi:predicted nucleic acid-binding protein